MGAVLHPVDNKTYVTSVAVVDKLGKYVVHKEFLDLITPK